MLTFKNKFSQSLDCLFFLEKQELHSLVNGVSTVYSFFFKEKECHEQTKNYMHVGEASSHLASFFLCLQNVHTDMMQIRFHLTNLPSNTIS